MKSILITGGLGFIGQNLAKKLSKKNKIIILDNLSAKKINKNFLFEKKNVKIIKCSLSNIKILQKKLSKYKIDYVIHAAAHFANQNSIDYPEKDLKTNILGTLNILKISDQKRVQKFIYLSSSCVYSEKKSSPMQENDCISPTETPYAISKYTAELYTRFFHEYYNLNTSIVRIFNTYGPGEIFHKYRNVIPNFIYNSLRNKTIFITGNKSSYRDYTFVDDAVNLISKLLVNKNKNFQLVNSCTGKKTKIINLARKIIFYTGSKSKIKIVNKRKWDNINHRSGSIKKIKKIVKIKKYTSLDKGLLKTINWYKSVI